MAFIYSYSSNHEVATKHPREKIFDPRNTYEKKVRTHEILTRSNLCSRNTLEKKILNARNTHEKKFRTSEGTVAPWHETHEIHGGTRPAKFSTLNKFVGSRPATLFKERLLHMCFPVNFSDLFGTVFYRTPVNGYLCFT